MVVLVCGLRETLLGRMAQAGHPKPDRATQGLRVSAKGRHIEGVLAHHRCQCQPRAGPLEEINNKIEVIKRMAHGFRDDEHFFPKNPRGTPRNS